jgi:beta-galactosidase
VLRGGVLGATGVTLGLLGDSVRIMTAHPAANSLESAAAQRDAGALEFAGSPDGGALEATGAHAALRAASAQVPRSYRFNQHWLFGGKYVTGAELPGHNDKGFARVTLPHTVTRLSWADWNYASWQDVWIYRKHFNAAAAAGGGRVLLTFDGVMTNATVVLNGARVGSHKGGYLPWTTELTHHLRSGDNVLAVIVDGRWLNVPPNAESGGPPTMDYLQPAGIYRDVRLDVVPEIYLADIFARPENVLTENRVVKVQATVHAGAVPAGRTATFTAALLDGSHVLGTAKATLKIDATGTSTARLTISDFGAVSYWSPENPKLYTVRTTLSYKGGTHTVNTTTGFREAVFTTGGFYLNGSRYEIFGLNRHQQFPYLGMAAPARLQRRDAEILKNELNCNMVRCSHYPQSPHFLDACDELGIMVWQEPPGWGYMGDATFQQEVLENVRDMVVRDRNRPSVVVWGTRLDETKNYPALYARTREIAYACDGSRQTAGAVTSQSTKGWAEDVFSYDDYHIIDGVPELLPPVPGVPYFVSEAIGAGVNPTYRWFDPPSVLASQAFVHAQVHEQAQANPGYAGLLAWTGIDYYSATPKSNLGQAQTKNWRTMRTPGVVDVFRVPKPGAAIYQSQIDPAARPVIVPVFFWDNQTPPGADAMFATNCDRLEIYVVGLTGFVHLATGYPDTQRFGHLACPPVFADLTVTGHALPDLRVDGYVGASTTPAATLLMSANTSWDRLHLSVADTSIIADGSDATAVTFRATDAHGNQRQKVTGDVTLTVTGPASLVGSNPFPFGTLGGVGGAFVRSIPGKTGRVTITARHATLGKAAVVVTVATARSEEFA